MIRRILNWLMFWRRPWLPAEPEPSYRTEEAQWSAEIVEELQKAAGNGKKGELSVQSLNKLSALAEKIRVPDCIICGAGPLEIYMLGPGAGRCTTCGFPHRPVIIQTQDGNKLVSEDCLPFLKRAQESPTDAKSLPAEARL